MKWSESVFVVGTLVVSNWCSSVGAQHVYQFPRGAVYHTVQPVAEYVVVDSYSTPAPVQEYRVPVSGGPVVSGTGPCDCSNGHTADCVANIRCRISVTGTSSTPKKRPVLDHPDLVVVPPSADDCEPDVKKIPFYDGDEKGTGQVNLPKKQAVCKEVYHFKNETYTVCGCTIKVCIPCKIEIEEKCDCVPTPTSIPLVARIRRSTGSGPVKADIWAYEVPGLPSKAVLATDVASTEANSLFPGAKFTY